MQSLLFLLSGVLMGSWLGVARPALPGMQPNPTASEQPFSRANRVLVHTPAPADSVGNAVVHHLRREGFTLDTLDLARGLITTLVDLQSPYRQGSIKIRVSRLPSGTDWTLIGTYVIDAYGSGVAYPAEFRGAEIMPAMLNFRMVEKAAQAIPRGRLRYARGKVPFGVATRLEAALKASW